MGTERSREDGTPLMIYPWHTGNFRSQNYRETHSQYVGGGKNKRHWKGEGDNIRSRHWQKTLCNK